MIREDDEMATNEIWFLALNYMNDGKLFFFICGFTQIFTRECSTIEC